MFASNAWIYLLTLTLVICIASRDGGDIQGSHQRDGPPRSRRVRRRQSRWWEGSDGLTKEDTEQITKKVNMMRRLVDDAANMNRVGWTYTSAIRAKKLAERCGSTESKNSTTLPSGFHYIQKYYATSATGKQWDPMQLFNRWFDEMYVDYTVYHCTPKTLCLEANKVLLARSRWVGCAMKACDPAVDDTNLKKGKLLVCSFVNMPSYTSNKETPGLTYMRGKPCSKCAEDQPRCDNNLCDNYAHGFLRASDAARPVPAHPSTILIAMATGLAITAVGTRLVDL